MIRLRVACLAGNTGSGMFLDVAYLARQLLRKQGVPHAEIIGVFLVSFDWRYVIAVVLMVIIYMWFTAKASDWRIQLRRTMNICRGC